jgi:hypothetical protein
MGIIRGGALVIVSVLFFIGLLICGGFLAVANSLEYDNIESELVPVVKESLNRGIEDTFFEDYYFLALECKTQNNVFFNQDNFNFSIPCEIVLDSPDAILNFIIDKKVEEIYYTEYDCGFWDCFSSEQSPFFLISKHSEEYFSGKVYFISFILLIFFGLILFLSEKRSNAFLISGVLLIVAGLPFSKADLVLSVFSDVSYLRFFTFIFNSAFNVFIKFLIFGILLILISILWKFFSFGFKIKSFFEKIRGMFGKKRKVS